MGGGGGLKGRPTIKLTYAFNCIKAKRQKFNGILLFPLCRHQYMYQIFENLFTSLVGHRISIRTRTSITTPHVNKDPALRDIIFRSLLWTEIQWYHSLSRVLLTSMHNISIFVKIRPRSFNTHETLTSGVSYQARKQVSSKTGICKR